MLIIDELDNKPVSEMELRDLLQKYEALYIEEPNEALSEEYYELDLYLEARLSAIEELKEAESEEVKRLKARIRELEAENKALYKRAKGDGVEYLSKQDIMEKFSRKSDWALKLLKLMFQEGKAVRLGKEYYTRESDISNFLDFYKGKEVLL